MFTVTCYYYLDFLGEPVEEGKDLLHFASWTLRLPLSYPCGLAAEVAASLAPKRVLSVGWLLFSTNLEIDPCTLLDFGLLLALDDAVDWAALIGFGRSLGHL